MMITIETDRLTIRNFGPDDWQDLQEVAVEYQASESAKYEDPWPTSAEEVKGMVEWFAKGDGYLAVCLKATGKLIGLIAIERRQDQEGAVYNLGYVFHPGYHGHGYATEGCRAAMAYVFDQLAADGILTGTHPDNEPSVRLLKKLGLSEINRGEFAISREEWLALWERVGKMESYRKLCLKRQTELRRVMTRSGQYDEAIQLFLSQHAMLHSAKVSAEEALTGPWSFEDEILNDMTEERIRRVPRNCEHSVAWIIWHIARCEDITMNLLVAGSPQVLNQEGRLDRINSPIRHAGNEMDAADVARFSDALDIDALQAYRVAVGRRTREIVKQFGPEDLKQKVDPARLQRIWDEGAVVEAASGIVDYWGKRDVAGLLLMPASRHLIIHLNEALKLKRRRQ
jgi:RimJ/RimL family protein N-acetyltransferase